MGNTTKTNIATQTYPTAKLDWEIDFGDHAIPEWVRAGLEFTYNNALYDGHALWVSKVGIEMSKVVIQLLKAVEDGDDLQEVLKDARSSMDEALSVIKVGWNVD